MHATGNEGVDDFSTKNMSPTDQNTRTKRPE